MVPRRWRSSQQYSPHCHFPPQAAALFPSTPFHPQVCATLPFQIVGSLVFTFVLYGMAGMRNAPSAILQNGAISAMMSLISIQVGRAT